MPVKKLRISFDLDMEVFAKVLALGHADMHIEAYQNAIGDEPRVTHTKPAQITSRNGIKALILSAMKEQPKNFPLRAMKMLIVDAGYSVKSLNSQLHVMVTDKLVRSNGKGLYAITKKGLTHARA